MVLIAAISQDHPITISSLRSDHSMNTTSGNVSNHYFGRAVDIAAIDGVSCTVVTTDGPCGRMARALALLPPGQRPTELIFCFDPDGPGPGLRGRGPLRPHPRGLRRRGPGLRPRVIRSCLRRGNTRRCRSI